MWEAHLWSLRHGHGETLSSGALRLLILSTSVEQGNLQGPPEQTLLSYLLRQTSLLSIGQPLPDMPLDSLIVHLVVRGSGYFMDLAFGAMQLTFNLSLSIA